MLFSHKDSIKRFSGGHSSAGGLGAGLGSPQIVQGILPIAKSTVSGWALPGHGDSYSDCGHFWMKGCLDVGFHEQARIDGVDVVGKVYVKVVKRTCLRAECPICYEKWAGKQAHRIEYRLASYRISGKPIHLIVSPPARLWGMDLIELRRLSYKIAKNVRFLGGSCIFHPFRQVESTKKWFFSPHFHAIGYGWIQGVKENYERTGWIVKNAGVRKSVGATALYQLSHAGIHKHHHTVTWFGNLAYNKLRVVPEVVEEECCPLCKGKLFKIIWVGDGECPIPDEEGDYFVEPAGWMTSHGWG